MRSPALAGKLLNAAARPRQREDAIDPRLRSALRARLTLGPATRLLAFDAAVLDPPDAAAVAHLALCDVAPWPPGAASCTVAADPLRLPFVEALFDVAVVSRVVEASDAPAALLREVRRVIAPAGVVWLIVPRRRLSLDPLPGHHFARARLERLMVEAMLEPVAWERVGGCHLVRAQPMGGLGAAAIGRVAALRPVRA